MRWLIDTSALVRLGISPDAEIWGRRIHRGLVSVSTATRLEVGYTARSGEDWDLMVRSAPMSSLVPEYLTPVMENRALEVQGLLAQRGQHRAPALSDLLLAATAEISKLTVLHVDKDFDLIAEVTMQAVERLTLSKSGETP